MVEQFSVVLCIQTYQAKETARSMQESRIYPSSVQYTRPCLRGTLMLPCLLYCSMVPQQDNDSLRAEQQGAISGLPSGLLPPPAMSTSLTPTGVSPTLPANAPATPRLLRPHETTAGEGGSPSLTPDSTRLLTFSRRAGQRQPARTRCGFSRDAILKPVEWSGNHRRGSHLGRTQMPQA